jgi:hypothetical protein
MELYNKIRQIDKPVKIMIPAASHEHIESKEDDQRVVRKPVSSWLAAI